MGAMKDLDLSMEDAGIDIDWHDTFTVIRDPRGSVVIMGANQEEIAYRTLRELTKKGN
jgi:hypothetical protein